MSPLLPPHTRKTYVGADPELCRYIFLSRCWSGYSPQFSSGGTAKTNSFVYGTINYYGGCSPGAYVCDFKVCVEKGYAAVRSKGSTEYIPVSEWLRQWSVKISK